MQHLQVVLLYALHINKECAYPTGQFGDHCMQVTQDGCCLISGASG